MGVSWWTMLEVENRAWTPSAMVGLFVRHQDPTRTRLSPLAPGVDLEAHTACVRKCGVTQRAHSAYCMVHGQMEEEKVGLPGVMRIN